MEKPIHRGRHRTYVENEIIRRREKQFSYEQLWNGANKYFQHWEKANTKFESWTSPRYFEDNNKLITEIKNKRSKEEFLLKRREKLRKLLDEEQRSYDIELMVHRNKNINEKSLKSKLEDIPTDVLKEVNVGLKLEKDDRRRHEAELKLYHQWRKNNPIVRQYESKFRCKDIKLSWLDQQIKKRMQKEKEAEENRIILKEREAQLQKQKEEEDTFKKYVEEKRQQLKNALDQQMVELREREKVNEELKKIECAEMKRKILLSELNEKQVLEEKRRKDRECALYNIHQHKLKLKQKAIDIQENLIQERILITRLKELEIEDILEDENKRTEIKKGFVEFLNIIKQQQELERKRQKHLEFLFDSEAKVVYEKQAEIWRLEEIARKNLVKQVIDTVQNQIEENLRKNQEKQKQLLTEREEMTKKIEEYATQLQKLKEEEQIRKQNTKKIIDEDIKVKKARKKLQESSKLKEITEELERIHKEEEKLQQEILKIQQRQVPIRPPRSSRLFF